MNKKIFFVFLFLLLYSISYSAMVEVYIDTYVNGYVLNNLKDEEIIFYLDKKDEEQKLSDIELGAKYIWLINPPYDRDLPNQLGDKWKYLSKEEKNKFKIKWFKTYINIIDLNDLKQHIDIEQLIIKGKKEKENYEKKQAISVVELNKVDLQEEKIPISFSNPYQKMIENEKKPESSLKEGKPPQKQPLKKEVKVKKKDDDFIAPQTKVKEKIEVITKSKKSKKEKEYKTELKIKDKEFENFLEAKTKEINIPKIEPVKKESVKKEEEESKESEKGKEIVKELSEKKEKLKKLLEEQNNEKIDETILLQRKILNVDKKMTEDNIKEKDKKELNMKNKSNKQIKLPTTLSNE
ncbi:MAG TPA: hypothetical protein PLD27_00815 [bacterium]|nr:hypothetical protein [bacterium]HOL46905.1 hypothetical protein [bacterium]HPQ18333.1 hypothetical protein [bacterium]